jgi:hypothetical protein
MKANLIFATVLGIFSFNSLSAQDRTIVNATSSEVSDNLDLRAVASIFGDALNLEDFENKINDPKKTDDMQGLHPNNAVGIPINKPPVMRNPRVIPILMASMRIMLTKNSHKRELTNRLPDETLSGWLTNSPKANREIRAERA